MERRSERIFGQRYGCQAVKIEELNMHLMCVLCGGYYIDATTIIECLHSFCRSCIVRYLESSSRCPICDVLVHKAQPLLNIRLDHVLQGLVYKLVPGLLTKEMNCRREFYSQGLATRRRGQPRDEHTAQLQSASNSEEAQQKFVRSPSLAPADSESLSISLEYFSSSKVMESRETSAQDAESLVTDSATDLADLPLNEYRDVRYLLCPAGFTVGGLKKFIRAKFDLPLVYQIDIFHGDERLENHFSMLDVAFIFQWQKRAPMKLRYSVSYMPRTKRKMTANDTARRQNSKENETLPSGPKKNGEGNRTPGQDELKKSRPSACPGKTLKHADTRTRQTDSVGDHWKPTVCKENWSTRAKQVGCGVVLDEKSPIPPGGGGSGCRDAEQREQHDHVFEDTPNESLKSAARNDERVLSRLTSRGNSVSKDSDKARETSDRNVSEFKEFSETQCNRRKQTRKESGGQTQTTSTTHVVGNTVCGASQSAELTIDLTGDELNGSVTTLSATGEVAEARFDGDISSSVCPESVSRVVGSVTFVGNGSATVLNSQQSVLCGMGQIPSVNGDIAKSAITLPCINAFKTLSCGLHGHHFGYASDAGRIVGESVMTDDVMKIISTPEVTIVPSFGVQLIYSPDALVSQNPICGVIQLPEAPVSVTSDALVRAPAWGHGDSSNGIMSDADFQRLCEGKTIRQAEKDFGGGCFEHFVVPNLVDSIGGKMSDEMSLGYAVSLDSAPSGSLPCVFVAQATGHQPQNSWSLPESNKDAGTVDWGLCYPVAAAEFGAASLAGILDEKHLEQQQQQQQPECSFVCVTSDTLPGSTAKPGVVELWSQGPCTDGEGTVETQTVLDPRGEVWAVESRQSESRAVKMCIVEPQAVKRRAENDWAVVPKEAKTSCADSDTVKTRHMGQKAVETKAEGNVIVERQAVETQTMGLYSVESLPEVWAVEPRTMEPAIVEPTRMEPQPVEQGSLETATEGLQSVEIKTTSSCTADCCPEEPQRLETEPRQPMFSKLNLLEVPDPVTSKAAKGIPVELQTAQSQTAGAWTADESLVEPDEVDLVEPDDADLVEPDYVDLVESDDVEPDDVEPDDVDLVEAGDADLVEPDGVELVAARVPTPQQPKLAENRETGANHVAAEACPQEDERTWSQEDRETQSNAKGETDNSCVISLPMVDSSSTVVSEDSENPCETATMGCWEETAVLHLKQWIVTEANSVDCVVENAVARDSVENLDTMPAEKKCLFSGNDLAEFHDICTDWSCSAEAERLTCDAANDDPDSGSSPDLKAVDDTTKAEDSSVSAYSETSSSSPEGDAVCLSTKPEVVSYRVEDESVTLEEERLVIDTMEPQPGPAGTEDVPAASDDVDNFEILSNSYSHRSDSMPLSPGLSKAMFCRSEPSVVSDATEEVCVSSTSVSHCPVSAVDTGVLLLDDSMFVSVTDDHVMVCIRDREGASVAEASDADDALQMGIAANDVLISDEDSGIPVTKSCTELPVASGCTGILVADACYGMLASGDCTEIPISDSCNRGPVTDVCDELRVAVSTLSIPVSAVTNPAVLPNAEETDDCVAKITAVQSLMVLDETKIPSTTQELLVPCISNDSTVSDVPEKMPVSVIDDCDLTNSSAGELSVPIPAIPTNSLPVEESVPGEVSLTPSLEVVPVCSSSLEAMPLCTGISVCSPVISPHAGCVTTNSIMLRCDSVMLRCDSNHVAQHGAIENQVTPTGDEFKEEGLSHYIFSTCDLGSSEVVPVSQENLAPGDTSLRPVEMSCEDGSVEGKDFCRLDSTDEVEMNGIEQSLVTEVDVGCSSFPMEYDNGKPVAGTSHQNFGLLDIEHLEEDTVPGCLSKVDLHSFTDNDQKSAENRVNVIPSDEGLASHVEKRENSEEKEENGIALSQRLLCSGSLNPEDEERRNFFRPTERTSRSFSFSNISSGGSNHVVPSVGKRRRSRSLDESAQLACGEEKSMASESNTVHRIDCVLLKEKTVLLDSRQDTDGHLSPQISDDDNSACGDKILLLPVELTDLNTNKSCMGHVSVSSFQIKPFITNVQNEADAVNISPMNDVVGVGDEHADACRFVTQDTSPVVGCDNLKSSDGVSEKNSGEMEMGDECPVDV